MKLGLVTYQLGKDWDVPTLIEKLTALKLRGGGAAHGARPRG